MPAQSTVIRHGLLWVLPIAAILLGIVFVKTSLDAATEPIKPASGVPTSVRSIAEDYATKWAPRQVPPGTAVSDVQLTIVKKTETQAPQYTIRAIVVQVNSDQKPGDSIQANVDPGLTTMISCVEWQVDSNTQVVAERQATIMRTERGKQAKLDNNDLESRCKAETFL